MSARKDLTREAGPDEEANSGPEASGPPIEVADQLGPLPRPQRKRRRARSERGLPTDQVLARLARGYLEIQGKSWPKLVDAGLLPSPTDEVINDMVRDFKFRHRSGKIDLELLKPLVASVRKLSGMYCRYSCDNSSDLSIDDQMAKILPKALADGCFIPWSFVYSDYSVTGQDASRQGYTSYKQVLANGANHLSGTYIDDFSRASRNEIEWWRLAALSKRLGKQLIGASDGFDLSHPDSDVMITIYGLLSRLFLKSLKQKVKRGMHGAARRGTCLGKLSLGFTRRALRNSNGDAVLDSEGVPTNDVCIDPATCGDRLRIYQLFVTSRLSAFQISRQFNMEHVDGWNGWTESVIKKLLRNPSSIGVFIWNKTRREYDPETEKWTVIRNPRNEWTVNYRPELGIVPMDLWRAARRKLTDARRSSPLTGRDYSRNQISATTLFSGTLYCGSCGAELKLIRSTKKYKQMGCLNGVTRSHNCKLATSKSVRVIEECLLAYLRDAVLTDSAVEQTVAKANEYLEEESKKPAIDTAPLKSEEKSISSRIDRLVRQIEATEDKSLTSGYVKRVAELEKQRHGIRVAIRNANVDNNRRPRPLEMEQTKVYIEDLRRRLEHDTAEASAAIRMITGPISIGEEKTPGRGHGTRWIAKFSTQWNAILRHISKSGAGSESVVGDLELATSAVEVPIENIPQYELLAEKFKRLHDQGSSISSLAAAHNIGQRQTMEILHFANTGERPKWETRKRTGRGQSKVYVEIAAQVTQLRDKQMSFKKIAAQLKVAEATVRRAYDYARPAAVLQAAENSTQPRRGRYAHLPPEAFDQIRERSLNGESIQQIAAAVGCSGGTVSLVRKRMREEREGAKAG